MHRLKDPPSSSALLTVITGVLVVAGLYFGREVLMPLALAVIFSFILTPVTLLLERCRLGRVPATLIMVPLALVLLGSLGWLVTSQLMQITAQLPDYKANVSAKIEAIDGVGRTRLKEATGTVKELNKALSAPRPSAHDAGKPAAKDLRRASPVHPIPVQLAEPPSNTFQYLRGVLGPLVGPLRTLGIVVVFTLFILIRREDLRNRIIRLAGQGRLSIMTQAFDDAARRLSRYFLMQFLVNATYGLLFGLGLHFIGIPHAVLWGVLGFLLRFVPYFGTLIATAFPVVLAVAIFPGWTQSILTLVLFLTLELVLFNLIEPWLYGAHTGISSLAVVVAAVFWTMLWGPVGLLLSTPLTVCLMVLGRYVPQLGFLEILLGDGPVLSPEMHFYQRLLAADEEEAADIALAWLKENSLQSLYESVFVPALRLAETDRHRSDLDEGTRNFILQSTRELVEELGDPGRENGLPVGSSAEIDSHLRSADTLQRPLPTVVCIPARDEADEIVGMMIAQVLQRTGYPAHSLGVTAGVDALEQISGLNADVACVSALPPFVMGHARSICKKLRKRFPGLKIILGLWTFEGSLTRIQERVGSGCADALAVTLTDVRRRIQGLGEPAGNEFKGNGRNVETALVKDLSPVREEQLPTH